MVGALTKAENRKKILEEVLYETFILVSEVFKQQMIDITASLKKAKVCKWTSDEQQNQQKQLFGFLSKIFNGERYPARLSLMFSLMICTHKPEVLWLDEIAEAIFMNFIDIDVYFLKWAAIHQS